jgi:hypothetical protein
VPPTASLAPSGSRPRGPDDPRIQVAMLLALMRELRGVMQAEAALLRGMRLDRLRELQAERAALAEGHARALRRLRRMPEAMAALDGGDRGLLEAAMREFQAAARRHAERLARAHAAAEGVARAIGASLGAAAGRGRVPGASSATFGKVHVLGGTAAPAPPRGRR